MPFIDRRSPLTSMNARASDVAAHTVEQVVPIQQQRMMAAFRVQGIQGILYSRLGQGLRCTCHTKEHSLVKLDSDGKAAPGAINRVLTGHQNFGVSDYQARPANADEEFEFLDKEPTSPTNGFDQWLGDLDRAVDNKSSTSGVYDDGVSDGGMDLPDFDLNELGITDVSCPICFGSTYVGGYSMMRGFRKVFVPSEMQTQSIIDPNTWTLSPGTHIMTLQAPKGLTQLDVFRAMNGKIPVVAQFFIDNAPAVGQSLIRMVGDGMPHVLRVVTQSSITHIEIQFALSQEPMYFELPKRARSQDLSLLEQQEPFQIIVSPDVPLLNAQDIIVESQMGKHLIVTQVTPWNTRAMAMLGHEVQVRVAQPQELYTLLPLRQHVISKPQAANLARPSKSTVVSGMVPTTGFKF